MQMSEIRPRRQRCTHGLFLMLLQLWAVQGFHPLPLGRSTLTTVKLADSLVSDPDTQAGLPYHSPHGLLGTDRCMQYSRELQREPPSNKKRLSPTSWVSRYLSIVTHGIVFSFVMRVMNRLTVLRRDILLSYVFQRPAGQGLLTVCNHQSVLDDPGLWASVLPWWRMRPDAFRWTICTEDVFFYTPVLTSLLRASNVMPLDRNASRDQPMFQRFFDKLQQGAWCHIYAEGRVWQNWRFAKDELRLGPLKTGVGKLIAHAYPNVPVVIPMYHTGMDGVIPEEILEGEDEMVSKPSKPQSVVPRAGNDIKVLVGPPLHFHDMIKAFDDVHPGLLQRSWYSTPEGTELYREITKVIESSLLQLAREALQSTATSTISAV